MRPYISARYVVLGALLASLACARSTSDAEDAGALPREDTIRVEPDTTMESDTIPMESDTIRIEADTAGMGVDTMPPESAER